MADSSGITYDVDLLVQGYPGRSVHHGGLGWSAITLLRGGGRVALVDTGSFGVRPLLRRQLDARGVEPGDVTDVLLTHAHYDHAVNYVLFPGADVWIGASELEWAAAQPASFGPLPELYVRELLAGARTRRVEPDAEVLPGIRAVAAPGHTPGSLVFHLTGAGRPVLFTGDAAKNRAELLTRRADMSLDRAASEASFDAIWELWRTRPGTLLVPGHDVPMTLAADGTPEYADTRRAAIRAWLDRTLDTTADFDLSGTEVR